MTFKEVVLFCFDNKEYRQNWERLMGKKLHNNPKAMIQFIKDVRDLIWDKVDLSIKG